MSRHLLTLLVRVLDALPLAFVGAFGALVGLAIGTRHCLTGGWLAACMFLAGLCLMVASDAATALAAVLRDRARRGKQ